jgi:muramoyltetrapeptide carboxypeptidase LdcA involved in peptidoglycan recycling
VEVIEETFIAGRFPFGPHAVDGGVLLLETSEELLPARHVGWIVRAMGERGVLAAVAAVLVARPPVSSFTCRPPAAERARLRAEQRDVVTGIITSYNPDAVVCVGVPFGHTRPQWILPHGGTIIIDAAARRITADYS